MKAVLTASNPVSEFVASYWTPVFVVVFIAILLYALWPRNKATFDAASKMPLRED